MRHVRTLVGVSTGLAIASCGGAEQSDKSVPNYVKTEIGSVIANQRFADEGYQFKDINLDKLKQVSAFNVAAAGLKHTVEVVSLDYPKNLVQSDAKLYADNQMSMMKFSSRYPHINLPVMADKDNSIKPLKLSLKARPQPSILALIKNGLLTTPYQKQQPTFPAAATYYASDTTALKNNVSFVALSNAGERNIISVGVEACQAGVEVNTEAVTYDRFAQELVCNSLGLIYSYSRSSLSYEEYEKQVALTPHLETGDGYYANFLKFSEQAYEQIHNGLTPDVNSFASAGYLK